MTRTTLSVLSFALCVFLVAISPRALSGQNSTYRPGTVDPAGNTSNFTLFRDEQIFAMSPGTQANPWITTVATFGTAPPPFQAFPFGAVSSLPWSGSTPWQQVDIQAVAGRIVHPDKDDIVIAQRSETDGTKLAVRMQDGSGATLLDALEPRISGWTDFFATAEGDLDRLYDSQGNYHDEVVVAWMAPESLARTNCSEVSVPHIAVLNYNNGTTPSVLVQRVDRSDIQYMSTCTLQGYDYLLGQNAPMITTVPQPIDNIIATAVGDFDGDGYNEIAVAYMREVPSTVITVTIYRYLNDGTNASLTPVNTIDITRPAGRSTVGTLSLAAGNFDGSGIDELLVGTADWWGTPSANNTYQSQTFSTQPVFFLIKGSQVWGAVSGAASSGQNNSSTDFTVSLGNASYIPRAVTIQGATGSWAPINGTWPVTLTPGGFSLPVDSSNFGSFNGQAVSFSAADQLALADSATIQAYPNSPFPSNAYSNQFTGRDGPIRIDDNDLARIRVQMVPGLFHFDPNHAFDYRRRQVAVAWNARPSPQATLGENWDQFADTHLAIIQVTSDDKITFAVQASALLASFQTFQNVSLGAGAFRPSSDTNDPTWSLVLSGTGFSYTNPIAAGMVFAVWNVAPDSSDTTNNNLVLTNLCSGKASDDPGSPPSYGFSGSICQVWGGDARMESPSGAYPFPANYYLRLPAIGADLNGNSLRLGAPVHFEITNPGKADLILEQPPQHATWLDIGQGPDVQTINRYPSFNTSMQDSSKKDFASKTQNHLDWTVGGSETVTAKQTISDEVSAEEIGVETGLREDRKFTAKVAYDYDNVSSNYNAGYDSVTVGQSETTGLDDSLIVEAQILDLWRYRVYGAATADPNAPNAFYDIVIPGPSVVSNPGGRDVDWYQPVHEVGNILSYPGRTDACSPADIGPITIPNIPNFSNQVVPLIGCRQQFYNGNSNNLSLALDHQTGSGGSTDYTNKLHADLDFKFTFKASAKVLGTGVTSSVTSDTDIHGGADWGTLSTNDNSTTDATGITLNSPQGDSEHAYPYYPIFYNTTEGGLKVAYGIGDLSASSSGGEFWTDSYGSAPDPALNLPNRFKATYGPGGSVNGWEPVTTIVRKRMKGFVIRRSAPDPIANGYPLLGSNPTDGDTVLLEARVYNYSLSSMAAGPLTVQFSVIPYDNVSNSEICPDIPAGNGRVCPASARTIIGNGTSSPTGGSVTITIVGRTYTTAYLMWNTKGFGPATAGTQEYRVYVNLITNGQELYPPEPPCTAVPCEDDFGNSKIVDPGQNNEGWGLISVQKRLLGGPLGGSTSGDPTRGTLGTGAAVANSTRELADANGTDVLVGDVKARSSKPKPLTAFLHRPFSLRTTAFSSGISAIHGHVSIYDGKPGKPKSQTIAIKTLHGTTPDGTSSWLYWTPTKKGLHHLYAVMKTSTGDAPLGDVVIRVRRAPGDLNEDGRVDRHDLNMLQRDLDKKVAASACGEECDLDGDGKITQKDADLLAHLCSSRSCAFAKTEYVGGTSPLEPDMRRIRNADETANTKFLTAHPEEKDLLSNSLGANTTQSLYAAELQMNQAVQGVRYYYKGQPVTKGPYAPTQ